jgi:uncharacterized protein involved in exopolysaccharide biosynthesis
MKKASVLTEEHEQFSRTPSTAGGSLLTWLRVTIKWKRLVSRTTLAIVLLGGAVTLLLPNRYTATVVIMPPQSSGPSSSAALMAQMSGIGAM